MNIVEAVETLFTPIGTGRYLKTLEHDSLVIDTERNSFFWNSRGFGGDVYTFLTRVAKFSEAVAKRSATPIRKVLVSKDIPLKRDLHKIFHSYGKNHRDFWYERGFTDSVIDLYLLGYMSNLYSIPFIMWGELKSLILRGNNKFITEIQGSHKSIFGLDQIQSDKIFLVESPLDVPIFRMFNLDAISFTYGANAWDASWNGLLSNYDVTVIPDNDKAGNQLIKKLGFYCKVVDWPKQTPYGFDIGKLYLNNPGKFLDNLAYLDEHSIPITFINYDSKKKMRNM